MAVTYSQLWPQGVWPEVGYFGGHRYVIYQQLPDPTSPISVLEDGVEIQNFACGPGSFPRLADVGALIHDGTNHYYWPDITVAGSWLGTRQDLGLAVGAPGAINATTIAWEEWSDGLPIRKRARAGGSVTSGGVGGDPTGLSRILSSGTIVTASADRFQREPGGAVWGLVPSFAGALVCCSHPESGAVIRVNNDPASEFRLWVGQLAYMPRIATNGSEVTVVTWGNDVRQAVFPVTDLPVVPPPIPPPVPPPEPAPGPRRITVPGRPPAIARGHTYPHLPQIKDQPVSSAVRVLYDRWGDHHDRLAALETQARSSTGLTEAEVRRIVYEIVKGSV